MPYFTLFIYLFSENFLGEDVYLATFAMAEMGYMAMDRGEYEEALQWLDRSW